MFRIFDIDPAEFTEKYDDFINVVHPEDRAAFNQHVEDVMEGRKPFGTECRLLLKDGSIKHWFVRSSPIKNAEGEMVAAMEISLDITHRKNLKSKFNVRNTAELIKKATKLMLI